MNSVASKRDAEAPADGFRLGHRPVLDGLRGIFVALVILGHAGVPFLPGAWMGVDGFFVLSGFLITSLLLEERRERGTISLRHFYIRRALRILPALYVMLAVMALLTGLLLRGEGATATWRGIALSAAYVNNWFPAIFADYGIGVGLMSHTWSLGLEEQFYLVWPVLLIALLAARVTGYRLAVAAAILALSSPLWRVLLTGNDPSAGALVLGMNLRLDAVFAGCALAAFAHARPPRPSARAAGVTRWLVVAAVAALAWMGSTPLWGRDGASFAFGYTLIAVCAVAPILHTMVSPAGRLARLLSWRPLVHLGIVSYGLYLWHNPIFHLFPTGEAGWLDWQVQLGRFALTALFVILSFRYVEKPLLRLKKRFAWSGRSSASDLGELPHNGEVKPGNPERGAVGAATQVATSVQ